MRRFLTFLFILFAIISGGVIWLKYQISAPGNFNDERNVVVEHGNNSGTIGHKLQQQGLIAYPRIFYTLMRMEPTVIKPGEYPIPAHSSIADIVAIIRKAQPIQRQFTLVEGLTVKQAAILLQQNQFLAGNITIHPAEGSLMPDTYIFTRGETRDAIIKRMQDAQSKLLNDLWAKHNAALPLKSKEEAITLASIVEKETAKAEERPKIAGLFYNRLKIGMPLQTDPTVVYALTDGLGHMGGKPLFAKDLQINSPYNTYKIAGLPPGPIANPGKASLEAVFNPEAHNYLFFVADGTGGHVFSETLAEHNKNVAQWRTIKKEIQKKDN